MKLAFYKGREDLYDRLISWWTQGPYSHVELVISDNCCMSSSPRDGGIRFKNIDLRPDHWDLVELEGYDPVYAYNWFKEHEGRKYDFLGILGFVFGPLQQDKKRFFCTEAIGHALKMKEPWRLDPNAMYAVVTSEK